MTTLRVKLAAVVLAAASALTGVTSAEAFQLPTAPQIAASANVVDVQYRRHDEHRRYHNRDGWYGGHRGYRERRPGYRYHNGFWFPLAAFGAGAIIGGAMSAPAAPRGHVAWCESRYRTYRASDNTYVASAGVRRSCVSPY